MDTSGTKNSIELTFAIKELAKTLGFDKVGIACVQDLPHSDFFLSWIQQGFHGKMSYMAKNVEKRMQIQKLFPDAQSVIVVAQNYYNPISVREEAAKISRYAWGIDYHRILPKKLKALLQKIQGLDKKIQGRYFADTSPVFEKLWAVQAGLGWQGKNSCLICRDFGSFVFLGGIVINQILAYDSPCQNHCGTCTRCLEACPTHALQPYVLDATKCLAYLTIELREPIFELYQTAMGKWIFGCDICQNVCPWNQKFAKPCQEAQYQPIFNVHASLSSLLQLTPEEFQKQFSKTPVSRAKWHNFIRNVEIANRNVEAKIDK